MPRLNQSYGDCRQTPTGQWIVSDLQRLSAMLYTGQPSVLLVGVCGYALSWPALL